MSLSLMAWSTASQACSMGFISGGSKMAICCTPSSSRNYLTIAALCGPALSSCSQKLSLYTLLACGRQRFSKISRYTIALTFPYGTTKAVFHHNGYQLIPSLSHHLLVWYFDYIHLGGSRQVITKPSSSHLYDQGCSSFHP
jgi:hypothetical protein